MKKARRIVGTVLVLLVAIVVLTGWYLRRHTVDILQPAGQIGAKERGLMEFCALLSLIVVIPVFTILTYIAVHYREGNTKAKYAPDQDGNKVAEITWWVIPTVLIAIVGTVTWRSSYALDPFKPLSSNKSVLHVQVIALDWKWLFIYPAQGIASVNEAAIPVNTPVDFEITSDAVMTSFWVPQLGGQIYAMPGMSTNLNLMASRTGSFFGSPANISGKGFSSMNFHVLSKSQHSFDAWIAGSKHSSASLSANGYAALARPSMNNPVAYYGSVQPQLYNTVVLKYMTPASGGSAEAAQ